MGGGIPLFPLFPLSTPKIHRLGLNSTYSGAQGPHPGRTQPPSLLWLQLSRILSAHLPRPCCPALGGSCSPLSTENSPLDPTKSAPSVDDGLINSTNCC